MPGLIDTFLEVGQDHCPALGQRAQDPCKLNRFELLIDWGWFHFITKPLFLAMDWIYQKVGNFGVAILIITVLIKILFFPLANKSYAWILAFVAQSGGEPDSTSPDCAPWPR